MSTPHWKQWIKAPCVKAWAGMLMVGSVATAAGAQELAPLQTVELLHKAMNAADVATAAALLGYVARHGFALFAWWRIVVGGLGLIALSMGL